MKFNVFGTVTSHITATIEANSEDEALEILENGDAEFEDYLEDSASNIDWEVTEIEE